MYTAFDECSLFMFAVTGCHDTKGVMAESVEHWTPVNRSKMNESASSEHVRICGKMSCITVHPSSVRPPPWNMNMALASDFLPSPMLAYTVIWIVRTNSAGFVRDHHLLPPSLCGTLLVFSPTVSRADSITVHTSRFGLRFCSSSLQTF